MIEPYHKYPNLLDVLFNFLKTEHATGVRREVIRVLGLLGALDPYKHTQHQRNEIRSKMGTPISKPMDKKKQGTGERSSRGDVSVIFLWLPIIASHQTCIVKDLRHIIFSLNVMWPHEVDPLHRGGAITQDVKYDLT